MSDPQSLQKGIQSISKEVSRFKGQYGASSAEQFRLDNASTPAGQPYKFSRYEPPKAAQVADLIKRNGLSVQDAKLQAGYSGSDADLYQDLLKLVGL
jgi:hypothetical protein